MQNFGKVGFIGIGNMGSGMAANIAKAGVPLTVFDMDAERTKAFAAQNNCSAASSLLDLAGCDVIVTMLPTGPIVRKTFLDGEGKSLAAAMKQGAIIVDMSSSEPVGTRELGAILLEKGITLIDAPVSGGMPRAAAGTLAIMYGTDDEAALDRVMPLLKLMGDRLFATGGLGCGHAMKALNNYVAAACFAASAEAMIIGEKFGLDLEKMVDIMNVSTGRNFFTDLVLKDHVVHGKYASGFAVGLLAKDVKIAAELSHEVKQNAPVLDVVCNRWEFARDTVGATKDNTEAFKAWKQ